MDEIPSSTSRRHLAKIGISSFSLPPTSDGPRSPAGGKSSPAGGAQLSPGNGRSSFSTTTRNTLGSYPPINMPSHPKPGNPDSASYPYGGSGYLASSSSQPLAQQRKPLPGSPSHSSPPRFAGQLPPITSLLPPASQYPHPHSPNHSSSSRHHPLNGPLAPPAGMAPPAHHTLRPMPPQGSYIPDGLPRPQSMGGPFHEFSVGSYPVVRESSQQDRPFKCDLCTQCFSRNHDLKRHRRIHMATKPFPCPYCDKCFSRKDALKRHRYVKACSGNKSPESGGPSSDFMDDEGGGGRGSSSKA
ncbi:putative C2H2 finger domain protein [Cladorrhinum sp. PSN259]|nr:putative C2H2 finger domain protein [Cladorrhinum sp. PSN259]